MLSLGSPLRKSSAGIVPSGDLLPTLMSGEIAV
jgi:hypothetical protein